MNNIDILCSEATLKTIEVYYDDLLNNNKKPGAHLAKQLETVQLKDIDLETFIQLLIQTKLPQIFAESAVNHDESDWTAIEGKILGDLSVNMPVKFYNNGVHGRGFTSYVPPIEGNLAYVPGALLQARKGKRSADLDEVIVNGTLDQNKLNELYERRLLPQLLQINAQALHAGKKAAITMPGIGTGCFAGIYRPLIKDAFSKSLKYVLTKHAKNLPAIDIVHYDPYEGTTASTEQCGTIRFLTTPSQIFSQTTKQLEYPEGTSAKTHILTSFVPWDHFSWPGNDFWIGSRVTDDGVKGASTSTMEVITKEPGIYNETKGAFEPADPHYKTWAALARAKGIKLSGNIICLSNEGKKIDLANYHVSKIHPPQYHKCAVDADLPSSPYKNERPFEKNLSFNQKMNRITLSSPLKTKHDRIDLVVHEIPHSSKAKIKNVDLQMNGTFHDEYATEGSHHSCGKIINAFEHFKSFFFKTHKPSIEHQQTLSPIKINVEKEVHPHPAQLNEKKETHPHLAQLKAFFQPLVSFFKHPTSASDKKQTNSPIAPSAPFSMDP